jgi:hypothetical protein
MMIAVMLKIRAEQLDVMNHECQVDAVTKTIAPFFRAQRAYLGDRQFRGAVAVAVAAAEERNLDGTSEITQYVCLRFMLGAAFEHDPQLPWVSPRPADTRGAAAWVDATFRIAIDYLDDVAGRGNEHFVRSLVRARRVPLDRLGRYAAPEALDRLLTWINAAKTARQRPVSGLGKAASTFAASQGITTDGGIVLCAVLMFLLGTGFGGDPQFLWAAEALQGDGDEASRMAALHRGAQACAGWYLEHGS